MVIDMNFQQYSLLTWLNKALCVIRKSKDHTQENLAKRCLLNASWQQLGIHDWSGQKKAKVDTETIQTLNVHIAVLMLTLAISQNTYQQEVLLE